ncbi:ABC transporter substrate-binding protein [Nocardiopsis salina]|uniref:ABC transporter substrate-binding protein n=1 Tax=Nocardiopsis salina TaxID=245836 RepID=UPI00034C2AB4|nr:ABC transporter substrate-binding protein [Nocardiopsis salina]
MRLSPQGRGIGAAALFMSLGLVLSACGNGDTGGEGDLTAPGPEVLDDLDEAVQVEFWHSMDAANGQVLDQLIDDFNAENEGRIEVTGSFQGEYDDALANHRAAIQQGDTAELIMIFDLGTQFMIDSGQTVPAQSFIDEDGYDTGDIEDALLNYFTVDDELRSFPFNNSTPLMYINRDAFEEAGLDPDDPPSDLASIREAAEELTVTDDDGEIVQYGFGAPLYGWYIEQFMARAAAPYCDGANGRSDRATEVLFDGPEGVELVEWWEAMIEDDLALQIGRNVDDGMAAFTSGRAAMTLESTGALSNYIEASDFEVGAGYFPLIGADDPGGSIIGGASLWINGEGHTDEEVRGSWEFVQYLLTPEAQSTWHAGTGYLAVNTEGYGGPEAVERAEEFPQFELAAEQLAESEVNENTAGCMMGVMSEARAAAEEGWEATLTSDATPEEAMSEAADRVGGTIEEYNASVDE